MIRLSCAIFALMMVCHPSALANDSVAYLRVAGGNPSISDAIAAVSRLRPSFPGAQVVSAQDCTNLETPGFLAVAELSRSAQIESADARCDQSSGFRCFVQKCVLREGGFLAMGLPVVDPSIERIPADVVNWTNADKISKVLRLRSGNYLYLRKYYKPSADDSREGRRTSVNILRGEPAKGVSLIADCEDAAVDDTTTQIAISCAREVAGDHFFHELTVYDIAADKQILSVPRCRNPKFRSARLECQEESIDANGALRLRKKSVL